MQISWWKWFEIVTPSSPTGPTHLPKHDAFTNSWSVGVCQSHSGSVACDPQWSSVALNMHKAISSCLASLVLYGVAFPVYNSKRMATARSHEQKGVVR